MEYSEIILIALILLIVFFGAQIPKVSKLLSSSKPNKKIVPVKTVLSATKTVETPRKEVSSKKKTTQKKTARKSTTKKAPIKKKTTKKIN